MLHINQQKSKVQNKEIHIYGIGNWPRSKCKRVVIWTFELLRKMKDSYKTVRLSWRWILCFDDCTYFDRDKWLLYTSSIIMAGSCGFVLKKIVSTDVALLLMYRQRAQNQVFYIAEYPKEQTKRFFFILIWTFYKIFEKSITAWTTELRFDQYVSGSWKINT